MRGQRGREREREREKDRERHIKKGEIVDWEGKIIKRKENNKIRGREDRERRRERERERERGVKALSLETVAQNKDLTKIGEAFFTLLSITVEKCPSSFLRVLIEIWKFVTVLMS